MVEDRDIHNVTLTGNWTRVKLLRGGSKQLFSRRNNWAIRPDFNSSYLTSVFSLREKTFVRYEEFKLYIYSQDYEHLESSNTELRYQVRMLEKEKIQLHDVLNRHLPLCEKNIKVS